MKKLTYSKFALFVLLVPFACVSCRTTKHAKTDDAVQRGWIGKWIGPEGTYLVVSKTGEQYSLEIHSLDGPATYPGTAKDQAIEFQRNGRTESLRAGDGRATGMKWLLDKKDCLVIQTGEGFCRD